MALICAFAAAAGASTVLVLERPDRQAVAVGVLRLGDVVEVRDCSPSCDAPGAWALLEGGAVPLRDLHRVPDGTSGRSTDLSLVWGTARTALKVRERAQAGSRVIRNVKAGYVLAFRVDDRLRARGWLEIHTGGFVALSKIRLAHPSALRGEPDPPPALAFVVRAGNGFARYARFEVRSADAHEVRSADGAIPRKQVRIVLARPPPAGLEPGERWLHVDLREQVLGAYQGTRLVFATLVSTGKADMPTDQGVFRVWLKSVHHEMVGRHPEEWHIEEVPFVLAYHGAEALHGAFWHDGFGSPLTHGCVNLSLADASWLFAWTPPALPRGWHAILPRPGLRVVVERAPFAVVPRVLAAR